MGKILITGITGFKNRGVDALVTTAVEGIREVARTTPVTILTDTPDYDEGSGSKLKVNFVQDAFRSKRARYTRKLAGPISKLVIPYITTNYKQAVKAVEDSDIVIASGGDVFSSDYGDLSEFLISLELAKKEGKKVVFLAQSIGPFKTKEESDAWMKVAEQSDLVTLRESLSYQYVTEKLGLSKKKAFLTADTAFNLIPAEKQMVDQLFKNYGIDKNKPFLALSVSQGIRKFAKIDPENHFNVWKKVIQTAVNELGIQVVLVPHVQDSWPQNDDRIVANELKEYFGNNDMIKVISGDHTASEYKGIISRSELVIAERMHAAIAGLSTGVATSIIGYSIKARGVLQDLLGEKVSEYDLLVSIQDLVSKHDVQNWLQKLWANRYEVSNHIKENLPATKERAKDNFRMLERLISK